MYCLANNRQRKASLPFHSRSLVAFEQYLDYAPGEQSPTQQFLNHLQPVQYCRNEGALVISNLVSVASLHSSRQAVKLKAYYQRLRLSCKQGFDEKLTSPQHINIIPLQLLKAHAVNSQPVSERRTPQEQARLDAMLRQLFEERIAFHKTLGFQLTSLNPEAPTLSFEMHPELIGHFLHGRLHGGVISAALDAVAGLAVIVGISEKFSHETTEQVSHRFGRVGTIDLRTDYLHQGIGKKFTATGRLTRLGGRIASAQMTLINEQDQLIATGSASYVIS